jgi:hypothetical protein
MRSRLIEELVMSTEDDRGYFTRRADQERAVAARAGDPAARHIHSDLAARYDALASESLRQVPTPKAA